MAEVSYKGWTNSNAWLKFKYSTKFSAEEGANYFYLNALKSAKIMTTFIWADCILISKDLVRQKIQDKTKQKLQNSEVVIFSNSWSKEDQVLPYQEQAQESPGLKVKALPELGPTPPNHLVSIHAAPSNEIWPALKENWIMVPSINTIFLAFEVSYVMQSARCHV